MKLRFIAMMRRCAGAGSLSGCHIGPAPDEGERRRSDARAWRRNRSNRFSVRRRRSTRKDLVRPEENDLHLPTGQGIGHDRFQRRQSAIEREHAVTNSRCLWTRRARRVPAELERKMDEAIGHYPADRKRSAAHAAAASVAGRIRFHQRRRRELDRGEARAAADQHSRTGHVLSDVSPGAGREKTYSRLPHIELRHGRQLRVDGKSLRGRPASIAHHRRRTGCTIRSRSARTANYSIEFVECLASCGTAPVCMVDDELHENVAAGQCRRAIFSRNPQSAIIAIRTRRLIRSSTGSFSKTSAAKIRRPTSIATCATAATSS